MVEVNTAFTVLLMAPLFGMAACGDDDEAGTTAGGDKTGTSAKGSREPILIKTQVAFLAKPKGDTMTAGKVLAGSTIGDSPFCPGGKFGDRHGEPPLGLVVKTIRCPGGHLTITFSPTQRSLKQSSDWRVVKGSGRFEGLSGGGQMKAMRERPFVRIPMRIVDTF